ncbi:MAG TPA: cytochrome P460 family protein [Pyrinomonadaceae bacterium]
MPEYRTSRGRTRIYLEGAFIWEQLPTPKTPSEHRNTGYGVVYANDAARGALKDWRATKLPAGSVIVRETLVQPGDEKPVLVVAMVKRAQGFNPKGGDWEFLVVDPSLAKVSERQKKGSCLKCHASRSENDFVFPFPLPTPEPARVTF